ncbi:MAG: M15 family metallopeptidase [Candidatus Falkowbacteria bacterium]
MSKIDGLQPLVRRLAEALLQKCAEQKIDLIISQGFRTIAEQDILYARGRTAPGKIVTQVKGGKSFHNYGVAFDFCPVKKGKAVWNDNELYKKIGAIGQSLGLEWGGSWKRFKDWPHFQYLAGYTIADFEQGKVDLKKFA